MGRGKDMKDYPRPQFKRDNWQSLDGEWDLNGKAIQVPYPPQAELSGYEGDPSETHLVYSRTFEFKKIKARCLLHFGAVDQLCTVYINGMKAGSHEGGYLPFCFDITDYVKEGINTITVDCIDTLSHDYPYGKQKIKRGGMWYTPFSGIWKSVWMEQVPDNYIKDIKIEPDLTGVTLYIDGEKQHIDEEDPILWTPDNPHLYYREISRGEDKLTIYYALRTVGIRKIDGVNRVCLNGQPIYLHGILDQGYYSEGLCTASERDYEKDILMLKDLGFNFIRKHIKVESESFYYLCDKLGILVMQDMVNSGDYSFIRDTALATAGIRFRDATGMTGRRKEFWMQHAKDTQSYLYNHPCVIAYTLFNEGWGQFESDKVFDILKSNDPSRLYDSTSGWFEQNRSDFDSKHVYFRTMQLKPQKRPLLLSEFGGYTYPVQGHLSTDKTYGYGACKSSEELTEKIVSSYEKMVVPAIKTGLCGSIYTQLSDIEDEINGLVTYDREIIKVDADKMKRLAEKLRVNI